jgi:glycosyltransferase involved in cell wall biosynthesis
MTSRPQGRSLPQTWATPALPSDLRPLASRLPIYVEASPLLTKNLTGIGRFAARLVEALARLTPLRLFMTTAGEQVRSMSLSNALRSGQEIAVNEPDLPPADVDVRGWARRLLQRPLQRHEPRRASRCAALYTMLRPGERHYRKELCLLHDFTPLLMPKAHIRETRSQFGELFVRHAALCDVLVANSHSTKHDAGWLCAPPRDRVVVGYPGPTLCVGEHAHREPVPRSRDFILVVSTLEPRKNGRFLLEWFLQTRVLDAHTELWWVGPSGWLFNQAASCRRLSGRVKRIRFLGVVDDRRLCELYRRAAFSVYPSLYEGFGFPVLDSLRHGTPVLSSLNSSLQEFAGPGMYYFDAGDAQSLDAACRELLASWPVKVARQDLDQRFSWAALAQTIVALCA